jgi:hypothetical protein
LTEWHRKDTVQLVPNKFLTIRGVLASLFVSLALCKVSAADVNFLLCHGGDRRPAVSGVIWLMANSWNSNVGVRVGVIENGAVHRQDWSGFLRGLAQPPESFRLLIGVSDTPVLEPPNATMGWPYVPDNHRQYRDWYQTGLLQRDQIWPDLAKALAGTGQMGDSCLVLPLPSAREIVLRDETGKPSAGLTVKLSLFGWNQNHCAAHFGVPLGEFTTDAQGRIRFQAPALPLYLDIEFFDVLHNGPAEFAYQRGYGIETGPEPAIEIRHVWKLPEITYEIQLAGRGSESFQGVRLEGCEYSNMCGNSCGPVVSDTRVDASGLLRVRGGDLRLFHSLVIVLPGGRDHPLSNAEMQMFLREHRLRIEWH